TRPHRRQRVDRRRCTLTDTQAAGMWRIASRIQSTIGLTLGVWRDAVAASIRHTPQLVIVAVGWVVGDATAGAGYLLASVLLAAIAATAALLVVVCGALRRRPAAAALSLALRP